MVIFHSYVSLPEGILPYTGMYVVYEYIVYIYTLDMNINDIWTDTKKLTKVHILCR